MEFSRRSFFKIAGATAGTGLLAGGTARAETASADDKPGVLVDTTRCVGCRACEAACAEANGLPPPPEGDDVLAARRDTSQTAFTVINRTEAPGGGDRFGKKQCMHCISPACASACPVRALDKQPGGPVTYNPSKCMGCRYCMVACPFDIPKYEYESAVPRVRKCSFCAPRQAKGLPPACAEVCPSGALTFGTRHELLEEAKKRIYAPGAAYVRHVYGEHEAGGTSWLYVSDVQFEKLALATGMPDRPYTDLVAGALGAPPFIMTLWPPLLMGLYTFSKRREEVEAGEHAPKHDEEVHHG
ncbi:MAG TPA: 4Fe-4S dicluster domain-containing protein [Anaeromyxobacteraceae bacterium]|nr:4Fe-4S dicluster domain-containing protein [Anaeromyxobacteraceae bacterium]